MGFQFIYKKKALNNSKNSIVNGKDVEKFFQNSKYSIVSVYKNIDNNITTKASKTESREDIFYSKVKTIDSGSFGIVYEAELLSNMNSNEKDAVKVEKVAIKKVLQDKRYRNRELEILKSLKHKYIVNLLYYFYSIGENAKEIYLNLIMEYLPHTCYTVFFILCYLIYLLRFQCSYFNS